MDFTTLLKGATDTLKKLENDVKSAAEVPDNNWKWSAAEDDGWEDVTDTAPGATELEAVVDESRPAPAEEEVKKDVSETEAKDEAVSEEPAETVANGGEKLEEKKEEDGDADLKKCLREAMSRAAAAERKVLALTKDRDTLRRIRDTKSSNAELVKEKDKQIKAVMEEGEKLSIKIADREAQVRNLKQAMKEKDSQIEDLDVSLGATTAKLEAAASRQRQLETAERSAADAREAAEKRLRTVEADARSKTSSSAALEAARAQVEALRKGQASALENQAMRLGADHEAAVEAMKAKSKTVEDGLNKAMMELRTHLSQVVENAGWREDQLRKEADELRKRAEQLEARNEELAAALPDATRPLLRQVEALQAAASERVRAKSAVDRSMLDRLRTAEASVAAAHERERAAEERIGSLLTKTATLEEQVKISSAEQSRSNIEVRRAQTEAAEVALRHQGEVEELQNSILKAGRDREDALEELSKERASGLDAAEAAEEREKGLRSQLAAMETKLEMVRENLTKAKAGIRTPVGSSIVSPLKRFDSMGNVSSTSLGYGSDFGEEGLDTVSPSGVYATERLSQSLRQRNGEIASLQSQLGSKEAATQALAEEVVTLTAKVEELTKEMKDAPETKIELAELNRRHSTLLELLGEREEKIMELQADLEDVNQMYKEQITELLLRIEKMSP